jgi:RimJ/RimL family protein N-acetyltransferase
MFMKGKLCSICALEESDEEAEAFTKAVNAGLTTKHMLTGSYPMRPIDIKEVWRKCREAGDVQFAVRLPRGRFVGTCGLHAHRDIYRSWEFRILIHDPSSVGHGIGTEAASMVVCYAFQRLNAHRIWLGVNEMNVGALECYKKVGFREEGRLRDDIFTHGEYHDVIRMGILEGEWGK